MMLASGPAEAWPSPVPLQPLPQFPSGSFFIKNDLPALLVSSLSLPGVLFGEVVIEHSAEPQRHTFWICFTRQPQGRDHAGTGNPWRGEVPCLRLEPRSVKEFSFLGVFACVLGCASKPLPTHLYANESSHMLGMFCPQILNTMYRRRAWLLQKQDLRGQLLPAIVSL